MEFRTILNQSEKGKFDLKIVFRTVEIKFSIMDTSRGISKSILRILVNQTENLDRNYSFPIDLTPS